MLLALSAAGESFLFEGLSGLAGAFDGIDTGGHAFLVEKLGSVGSIPLFACWSSDDSIQSPLLGPGWRIPLLESHLVPLDDKTYEFLQPDGRKREIRVSRKSPDRLTSNRVWSGRVRGDDVSLQGDVGEASARIELSFRKGRLARMKTEEGAFDFGYSGRDIEKISGKGRALLTIVRDARNPSCVEFVFAGRERVVAMLSTDGLELTWPDGRTKTFVRSMVGNDMSLRTEGRTYVWNRYSKLLRTYDGWTYSFGAVKPVWNNPSIRRVHEDGREETYWFNLANGKGEYVAPDGAKYLWARFPSGDLYGLMRWSEKTRNGELMHRREFTYDGSRRLVYERLSRGAAERKDASLPAKEERWYAQNGSVRRVRFDGKDVTP